MKRQPTAEQKLAAQAKREKFRKLAKQIADMPEAERTEFAAHCYGIVTVEGHALSPCNMMLVALQNPNATLVGGFRQWINHGRAVRKGEHGLSIWVPLMHAPKDAQPGADQKPEEIERHFIIGTVFDVTQTDEIETAETARNATVEALEMAPNVGVCFAGSTANDQARVAA